jgi:alkylhydroperoxidase/carboxymuconolactone decarboxylase family protein YurZ
VTRADEGSLVVGLDALPVSERYTNMSDNLNDAPVLDLLARMTADSLAASSLDTETLILVRIAALVAVDAAPVSYALNLEAAAAGGLDIDSIRGVLTAIAPIVGTARIAAATGNIVEALAAEVELADLEVAELWDEDDDDTEE